MWIVFKLIALSFSGIIYFYDKYLGAIFSFKERIHYGDSQIFAIKHRSKSAITGTTFYTKLDFPIYFKLTKEVSTDRFFKNLGFTKEFQTGDLEFDQEIYISSDNKLLFRKLAASPEDRALILDIFKLPTKYLSCDGKALKLSMIGDCSTNQKAQKLFTNLRNSLNADRKIKLGLFDDPFIWKALVVESLTWSFFGYAFVGFLEWMILKQDYHLDGTQVIIHGVLLGIITVFLLFLIILLAFLNSSRGHRIIVEAALLFGLSMPIAGVNILADLNRNFDTKPSIHLTTKVVDMEKRRHRTKRGYYYTYHLYLNPANKGHIVLPQHIAVESRVYNRASVNSHAVIEVGPGYLGYPWYRSFSFN